MKILLVITKAEIGGAQVFALNLARGLKESGENVVVAGGEGQYLPEELSKINVPFYRFKSLKRSYNPLQMLKFIMELRNYVKNEGFDIVHLNSSNALFGVWGLSFLNPKPKIIFTVHGLSFLDKNYKTNFILKYLYSLFFKYSWKKLTSLVFVSELNYQSAIERGLAKKGEVIYNGIYLPNNYFINKLDSREFLGDKLGLNLSDAYIYGSIGRLAYPKNYEFLINSHKDFKKFKPNTKLILIGEGPERAKYEALIRSLDLEEEVYLFGELKDASHYLLAFDLFVLPSIFEGMSLSLIEAVRAGIPALASRVGGNEEIVGKDNCFEVNNQDDFLRLVKTMNLTPKSQHLSSFSDMIKKYIKIYEI
ncbi:MAG: glycosyltransferase [Bacteroidetes bacterium]|nr:glycosyltransferase [Bacteroidota bacterium]